jgi:hypothetical protein
MYPGLAGYLAVARETGRTREFCQALQDMRLWLHAWQRWTAGWLGTTLVAVGVSLLALGWAWWCVLPTFVQLFEGMSLQLPLPTRCLLSVFKPMRGLGPGVLALIVGVPLALAYSRVANRLVRARALLSLKLAHAADSACQAFYHPDLEQDQIDLLAAALRQKRLDLVLDMLLNEQRLRTGVPWVALGFLAAALVVAINLTLLAVSLPLYQLTGCLC